VLREVLGQTVTVFLRREMLAKTEAFKATGDSATRKRTPVDSSFSANSVLIAMPASLSAIWATSLKRSEPWPRRVYARLILLLRTRNFWAKVVLKFARH